MSKRRAPSSAIRSFDTQSQSTPNPKKTPAKKNNPKPQQSKARPAAPQLEASSPSAFSLPTSHQQTLLSIFSTAFSSVLDAEAFPTLLQEIKTALFNRDFAEAFGREDYLEAYAARWSPTRALCYAAVLEGLKEELETLGVEEGLSARLEGLSVGEGDGEAPEDLEKTEAEAPESPKPEKMTRLKMVAIGGCAAEQIAFAAFISRHSLNGTLSLLDSGPWTSVTDALQNAATSPPLASISKYASEARKAALKPLIQPEQLDLSFTQTDVLGLDQDQLREAIGKEKCLVSLLFTLNELYTGGGIGKTTKLLKNLGEVLPGGSLLLVLDSPGSYSETALGKEKKKYPMQWLLNHTLLEAKSEGSKWEKLESDDSVWFRLPKDLKYPMELENMRYQRHLYRIERTS